MKKYTLFLLLALVALFNSSKFSAQCFPDGNALQFSGNIGSGARISFTGSTYNISSTPITIEAWIYYTGGSNLQTIVNTSSDGGGGAGGYALFVNNWSQVGTEDRNLVLQTKSAAITTTAGNVIPYNTWTHVAAVISNSTTAALYVNGVSQAITGTVNYLASTIPLTIGALSTVYHFNGKIDEVRIWNTNRASLLSTTYNTSVATNSTGLVGYFKMNQGTTNGNNISITTITNSVTGSQEGTLSGFSLTANSTTNFTTSNSAATITSVTNSSRCGTGTVTLGAASSGTINWYAALTGGTSLGTGTSFTTPSISSTTTYYVDATSGACTSTPRTAVTATVNSVPTISGGTPTLTVGANFTLTGSVTAAATNPWVSSNTSVATVNSSGVVTGAGFGSATITYTNSTGCTAIQGVAVLAPPPTITSFSPASGAKIGASITITGTNFSTTASNNKVWFGGVRGTVTAATATQLTVTVPRTTAVSELTVVVNNAVSNKKYFSLKNTDAGTLNLTWSSTYFKAPITTNLTNTSPILNFELADMNTDGLLDWVIPGNGKITLMLNPGASSSFSLASVTQTVISTTANENCTALKLVDLNNDGFVDILCGMSNNQVQVIKNNGNNTYTSQGIINFSSLYGDNVNSISFSDVNNDGYLDIMATIYGTYTATKFQVFTQNPSSPFTFSNYYNTCDVGNNISFVMCGLLEDLNADGREDAFYLQYNGGAKRSNGTSTGFTNSPSDLGADTDMMGYTDGYFVDYENDGDLDLVYPGQSSYRLFTNDGTGSLTLNNITQHSRFGHFFDIDNDGDKDIIGSDYWDISGSQNTGSSFSNGTIFIAWNSGAYIGTSKMLDLDGDGYLDITYILADGTGLRNSIFQGNIVPTISVTGTLNNFTHCSGSASQYQSVTYSCSNMESGLTVTPPTGFEVSTTTNFASAGTNGTPLVIGTSGSISGTLYIRMQAAANNATYGAANIVFSGTNATSQNLSSQGTTTTISISGTLSKAPGTSTTLTGTGTPASSNPWTSSNTSVATINSSGVVSAIALGSTTITYTNTTGCSVTATFTVSNSCSHTITLYDTYGDGWNGGSVSVIVGSSTFGPYTIASGSGPVPYTFDASSGATISVNYTAGGWPSENYFSVSAGTGTTLVSDYYPANSGNWTGTGACATPVISTSGTLSAFTKCSGVASTAQSFTVSGTAISSGVTITPPTGFEVSTSATFASSVGNNTTPLLVSASGTLTSTTIHVRMQSSANNASYAAANIVLSSPGATSQNVSCQGTTKTVPTIATTTPGSRCGTGTVSIGATASAGTINWYTVATGGTSLSTGTSYATGSISSTTTYYVDATNNGCTTATRSSVVATINSIPTISSVTPGTRCGTGSVSLGAAASAGTINWYLVSTGGTSQGTGTSFSTGSISSTTTYYVDATSNGCTTTSRTSVTATVNGLPTITNESLTTQTVCQNSAFSPISVTATGTGLTYQWYSNSSASNSGGLAISGATNASYTPPSSTLGTTYYYCIVSGTCSPSATSSFSGVFAVQGPFAGTVSISGSSAICTGTSKDLTLSGHSGSIQWQSSSDNSTWSDMSGSTSPILNTGNLTATTYFRAKLSFGSCTPVYTSSQLITVDPLSVAGTISGTASVCSGSTSALTLAGSTGTIVWTSTTALNGTYSPINGATSNSYTTAAITATTYYKAEVTSGVCPSVATAAYTVSTTPLGNIGAISGPSTATLGGTATYSVTAVTNATSYVWNLPAGMTISSNSNNGATIVVAVANNFAGGTLTAQAVGCTSSTVVSRAINAPAATTLTITTTTVGAPVFCGGTSATFSATTTSTNNTATYLWTLPTGVTLASGSSLTGSSITVEFASNYEGGTISVTRVSSTESLSANYAVGAIATPGVISGISSLCGSSSTTYSISSVNGANSYEWSLPIGMTGTSTGTSISASWSGSITGTVKVRAISNTCGTSAWRTLGVASVATPGAITGPTTTCGANSNVISSSGVTTNAVNTASYSIAAVTGATGYTWTVPMGMTITSGQGTTAITVSINSSTFTSGAVTVVATTTSCTSAVRSLSVSNANTTILGPTDLCGLATATYSINAPSGATVTWTLADWMSLASGQTLTSNPITVNIGAAPSQQNITASYSTSCGTATGSKFVGCNLFTQLESANCGATVDASQTVLANWVPNATNYRFTISGTGLSTPVVVTNSYRGFGWTQVSGYQLNATYSVKVALSFNGGTTFGSEGSTCTITPTAPTVTTSLESAYCGQSVAATQSVLATWVQGATSYRFTISGAGLSTPVVVTNNYRGFGWTQVPGYQLGTSYNVTVSLAFGGSTTFGNPGSSCTVTPTAPTVTTSLETTFCDQSVGASQTVLATWVQGATSYRFTISGAGLSTPVVVTNNYRGFGWTQVPGYQLGTSYTVTVSLAFGGSTTFGNPGSSCTVTPTAPTVTTSLETAFCDQSVGASQTVLATWVQGATSYRFTISGAGLSTPVVVTNNYRGFGWTQVPGYQLGTSYTVTVSLAFGGSTTFGNPGASCTVTPTAPTVTTSLETAFCDQSVAANQTVLATWIQGATSYRFTISGTGLSTPVVVTNNYRGFGWTQVPGYQLGTSYTVTVAIAFGGSTTFGNEGASCTVTPTAPTVTTSLETAFCGQSVAANQSVLATWIQGATSYRFTISGTGLANDVVVTNSWRGFSWASVPGYQLGSTYAVKVALAFGGSTTFGNDGTPCNVTLIAPQLTTQSCATQIYPSGGSSVITANTINGATGYQFTFTPTNGEPEIIYSTTNSIDMSLEGVADGSYTVTVAVAFGGTGLPSNMTYGAAGPGCNISFTNPTPLALQDPQLHEEQTEGLGVEESSSVNGFEENQIHNTTWTATATSNPFATSFQIKLNGAEGIENTASFTAQLTDMSGKVYSQATLSKEQLEAESFGEQLAPGMYLMTLRQGEELRAIRVVKR